MLTPKISLLLGLAGAASAAASASASAAKSRSNTPHANHASSLAHQSLNFGPAPIANHRHVTPAALAQPFLSDPEGVPFALAAASSAPSKARTKALLESLFGPSASSGARSTSASRRHGWYVRPDSYVDRASGISYTYLRQLVNGIEVDDGKAMVVQDAEANLLSYWDSFYRGPMPLSPLELEGHPDDAESDAELAARCEAVRLELAELLTGAGSIPTESGQDEQSGFTLEQQGTQMVFGSSGSGASAAPSAAERAQTAARIESLRGELLRMCSEPSDAPLVQGADSDTLERARSSHLSDPRAAVLTFVRGATVDGALAAELRDDGQLEAAAREIVSTFEHDAGVADGDVAPKPAQQVQLLHNVPGTTGSVRATLAYAQRPNHEGEAELVLGWKLTVPMDHADNSNMYETFVAVDGQATSVLSVVDWVRDAAVPRDAATAVDAAPVMKRRLRVGGVRRKRPSTGDEALVANEAASAPQQEQEEPQPEKTPLYRVFYFGVNDPTEANRTTVAGANDTTASPFGWHTIPPSSKAARSSSPFARGKSFDDLRGNRVLASIGGINMDDWATADYLGPSGKSAEHGDAPLYHYPFAWRDYDQNKTALSPKKYENASVTNLFYTLNSYLDLLQRYGFDAPSGNFEEAEVHEEGQSGYQGAGGDAMAAYAQSRAGTNNADCTTPPDGQRPRIRMYNWHNEPHVTDRDGDFEAGVIIHEATHGLSTRLTGGPSDSGCLGWGEAGGMGEGWGDFLATIVRRKTPTRDIYTMGSWVSHRKGGIRKYPYSTNLTLSPENYETLNQPGYWGVHNIGEVWSAMLYQVEEGLRAKLGWHHSLFPPSANATQVELDEFYLTDEEVGKQLPASAQGVRPSKRRVPRHGNTLAVQLVIDGMKLQPCRPNFLSARDAILTADKQLTGGAHGCLIWERFAQRGLGLDAKVIGQTPWGGGIRTNGHAVPAFCKNATATTTNAAV